MSLMLVKAVMTPNPVTITENTTLLDAMDEMRRKGFSRLLVTRDERLIGIVTELDLMRVAPSPATTLSKWEQNSLLARMTVRDVMTKNPLTISPEATVEEAALLMRDKQISGLPVVEDGHIVGIVTEKDLFNTFVNLMHAPAPGARITLKVENRVGVLAEVCRIVSDLGIFILTIATFGDQAHPEIILKVREQKVDELVQNLNAAGYQVVNVSVSTE